MEQNFHDFRHGKTFAHTEKKFGHKKALAQMQAVVLTEARKSIADVGRAARRRK